MKTRFLLFALLATVALSVSAQSNTYSEYLNKALSSSEKGDCETARKYYNVYKELSGKTSSSIEELIQDCMHSSIVSPKKAKYAINDKIEVDGLLYRVAYIEDGGAHGFAIYDFGAGPLWGNDLIKKRKIPTISEMNLIAPSAKILNLEASRYYWTLDKDFSDYYFTYNLRSKHKKSDRDNQSHGRILIYRF